MGKATTLMMLALVLLALTVLPAEAQEGFSLGANIPFNRVRGDLNDLESGNGVGMHGGYGINRYLSFVADVFRTKHGLRSGDGSIYLNGLTVDAKVSIPVTGSHLEPYLRGGVGRYSIDRTGNTIRGAGRQVGVGMDIVLFPELRFYVGLTSRRIDFDTVPIMKSSASTLECGITVSFL